MTSLQPAHKRESFRAASRYLALGFLQCTPAQTRTCCFRLGLGLGLRLGLGLGLGSWDMLHFLALAWPVLYLLRLCSPLL